MKTNTIKATQALIMLFATLIMAACAQKKGFTYSEAEATKQDIVTLSKNVMPFVIILFATVFLVSYVPIFSMLLPNMMN